jgi:hypothetical protein
VFLYLSDCWTDRLADAPDLHNGLNSNKGTKTLTGLSPKALKQPSDLFVVVEPPYSVGPPIDQYLQLSKLAIEWKELQAASKR